jgi:hypothetical protein
MGEIKESHEERTAHEPRETVSLLPPPPKAAYFLASLSDVSPLQTLHSVVLREITLVGSLVRILRFHIPEGAPDIHVSLYSTTIWRLTAPFLTAQVPRWPMG